MPIRLLLGYIKAAKKALLAVGQTSTRELSCTPLYHLEIRKDWNSASGISFLGSPLSSQPKAGQGSVKRRQEPCHPVRRPCVCKPSITMPAFCLCVWRVNYDTAQFLTKISLSSKACVNYAGCAPKFLFSASGISFLSSPSAWREAAVRLWKSCARLPAIQCRGLRRRGSNDLFCQVGLWICQCV